MSLDKVANVPDQELCVLSMKWLRGRAAHVIVRETTLKMVEIGVCVCVVLQRIKTIVGLPILFGLCELVAAHPLHRNHWFANVFLIRSIKTSYHFE